MADGKKYKTMQKEVTAIQFIRDNILACYRFMNKADFSVSFKNDVFTGIIKDSKGTSYQIQGTNWIVKDEDENIKVWTDKDFLENFVADDERIKGETAE